MSIISIVDQLLEQLEPIVKTWKKNHPVDATYIPDSARACLYQDVYNMGYVIFTADALGQSMEIRTLAELLAVIAKGAHSGAQREDMEKRLVEKIKQNVASGERIAPSIPKSIQLARDFDQRNNTRYAQDIEKLFDQLLDSFILRDGNVTTEELAVVRMYESLWKRDKDLLE